jgi:hypothetical protein
MSSIVGCSWLVDGGEFSSGGEKSCTEISLDKAEGDKTGDGEWGLTLRFFEFEIEEILVPFIAKFAQATIKPYYLEREIFVKRCNRICFAVRQV